MRVIALLLALAACHPPTAHTAQALSGSCNPKDYGAVGDCVTDDTNAIRATITACTGSTITLPTGCYRVSQHGSTARCLDLPAHTTLAGETRDTALQLAPNQAASTRPVYVSGDGATLTNLTIDGNKGQQAPDEHRAGVFVAAATHVTVQHVTSHDNTGDAIYVWSTSSNVTIDDFDGHDNDRDGVAITGGSFVTVSNSQLANNRAQSFDTEPAAALPLHDISLINSTVTAGEADTSTYVATISGAGIDPSKHSYNFDVHGNTFNGPVFIVYADHVSFHDNQVTSALANYPAVTVQGSQTDVAITNNALALAFPSTSKTIVVAQGNATIGQPTGLVLSGNRIDASIEPNMVGVSLNTVHDATLTGNTFTGNANSTLNYAVDIRAAVPALPVVSVAFDGNTVANFPTGLIAWSGVSPVDAILGFEASGNAFTGTKTAFALDYKTAAGTYEHAVQAASIIGNAAPATLIAPYPAVPVLIGGVRGAGGLYLCTGAPAGQIAERPGAFAYEVDTKAAWLYTGVWQAL